MAVVGSFGELVFECVNGGQSMTFNSLTQSTRARISTHSTVEQLPVVEFAGVDADRVTLTGVLDASVCADVDDRILELRGMLTDNVPRVLTRGARVFGQYLIESLSITEESWAGNGVLQRASYSMALIATRAS